MTVAERFITRLSAMGLSIEAAGVPATLRYAGQTEKVTPELLDALARLRGPLLAHLGHEADPWEQCQECGAEVNSRYGCELKAVGGCTGACPYAGKPSQ